MAAALLIGGVTACSDLTGSSRADGVYYLQSVNNNSLPFSYVDNGTGHTLTVLSDQYVLNTDGTYSDQQSYTDNGAQRSYTESGNWSQSGTLLTFTPVFSSTGNTTAYQATINTGGSFGGTKTMSVNFSGTVWYYST
jgi:NlpE N-terminal domain